MAEEEQSKSEQASQFKLEQAKKKGSVAKSVDINSFGILFTLLLVLALFGQTMLQKQLALSRYVFSNAADFVFAPASLMKWCLQLFVHSLLAFAPLFLLIVVVAVLINFCQTGPMLSTFPLKPDFKKINPAEGFKRLFSVRLLFESFKSVLKVSVLIFILYWVIKGLVLRLLGLGQADMAIYPTEILAQTIRVLAWCVAILLPIFLLDLIFVRRDFSKKMMMSRREVKDEYKQREGDPRIRAKIRELQKEARNRSQSLRKVKDADVLITNPTHLAIALKYDRAQMAAPMITAKGAGHLAKLMRMMAVKHHVPIVENRSLARLLFQKGKLDTAVPEKTYALVARLLVWVYTQREQRKNKL